MKLTKAQRETLRGMFGGVCAYCGKPLGDRWHADHVEAVKRDHRWDREAQKWVLIGQQRPELDTISNLMPACPPCNIDKHSLSLEEWRGMLERRCQVLRDSYSQYRSMLRFGLVQETKEPVVFFFERVEAMERAA